MIKENYEYIQEHLDNINKACDNLYKKWIKEKPYFCKTDIDREELKEILNEIKETHDQSKFSEEEFGPYGENFFGIKECNKCSKFDDCKKLGSNKNKDCKEYKYKDFDKAWEHHFKVNKHHWNHWCYNWELNESGVPLNECKLSIPLEMSDRYIIEMICDWTAMGYKFENTAKDFYLKNKNKIELNPKTKYKVELIFGMEEVPNYYK